MAETNVFCSLRMEGMEEFLAYLDRCQNIEESDILVAAFARIGNEVEVEAKRLLNEKVYQTPGSPYYVRTGRLRNSIKQDRFRTYEDGNIGIAVTASVFYAQYFEFGRSNMRARAFLVPAAKAKRKLILEVLKEAVYDFLTANLTM